MIAITDYGFYEVNNIVINGLTDVNFWGWEDPDCDKYCDFIKKDEFNKKDVATGKSIVGGIKFYFMTPDRIAKYMTIKWMHKNLLNYSQQDSNPFNFDKMEEKGDKYILLTPINRNQTKNL